MKRTGLASYLIEYENGEMEDVKQRDMEFLDETEERAARGLTVKKVRRLTKPGRYLDKDGLYLQVISPNNRSWLLRYQLHGKKRWMGLGSVDTFSLEEARAKARRARQLLCDKIDPLEARRSERAEQAQRAARSKSFSTVVREYFDAHEAGWSAQHRSDFLGSFKHAATLDNLPIRAVDEPLVLGVLQPLWAIKTTTAQRLRQRVEAVLDFAAAAGYRSGDNPARWKGHLEHLLAAPGRLAKVEHHAALPYSELPGFIREVREVEGIPARALEFMILTAARTGEVIGARWDEIDLTNPTWTVPAQRMKARREHRVPLSRQIITLLRSLPREHSPFVFIGAKAGTAISDLAMWRLLKRLRPDTTAHGFRATFRIWVEERTAFAPVLAEQALAHTVGSGVERAYRRTDLFEQRSRLMQAWADFIDAPVVATEPTPLRRVRALSGPQR